MLKSFFGKMLDYLSSKSVTDRAVHVPNIRPKLTRSQIIEIIKQKGTPDGLDFSGYDLSGVNLSRLDLHGIVFGNIQMLKFAENEDVVTKAAILDGAWLERCNLQKANFGRTSLKGVHFYHSDLSEATLWAANAEGSDFRKANLSKTNCFTTVFNNCRLMEANLDYANLHRASLSGATLSADSLKNHLLQENLEEYKRYFTRWYIDPHVWERYQDRSINGRYKEAEEIYLVLKNAFVNSGRYEDASWAYVKERQMERKSYFPLTARQYYGSELPGKYSFISFRWWLFYAKYTFKWLFAWMVELVLGYGERPLRVAVWSIAAIIFFAFAYFQLGGIATSSGNALGWLDYFQYSLATFSTIGFVDLIPINNAAKLLSSIESILGISALAMLMFSLGNRINRS